MLSLFSANKPAAATVPKPKKESENSDILSFINKLAPSTKDITVGDHSHEQHDDTEELQRVKPFVPKSTQKFLQKTAIENGPFAKEVAKASKKINSSLKQLVMENRLSSSSKKPAPKKAPKVSHENSKYNTKSRLGSDGQVYLGPLPGESRSPQSPNLDSLGFPHKDGIFPKKEGIYSSPRMTSHKRVAKPKGEEGLLRDPERLKGVKDSSFGIFGKKKDDDGNNGNYDPLEISPFSLKNKERLAGTEDLDSIIESNDLQFEQYDPLGVSVKKKNSVDEHLLSGKGDNYKLASLTSKRPMERELGSRYEGNLVKKVKGVDQGKKDLLNSIFKGQKKQPPKVGVSGNNRRAEYREYERELEDEKDSFVESDEDVEVIDDDDDDEAIAEFNKMMGGYRKLTKQRKFEEEDISDMEAGFEETEREERFSRQIGKMEDEEQLKYIALEELRERKGKMQ